MFINYRKLIFFIILIIVTSSLGIFAFKIEKAEATYCFPPGFSAGGCVAEISLSVSNKVTEICGKFIQIAANILSNLLSWGKFIESDIVKIGWKITRDLANMFFVLILMIIALAIILKVETYEMKTLLPKLIIAALLINFSLVFCGAIIDSSQVITNFFISQAGGEKFDEHLMNAFKAVEGLSKRKDVKVKGGDLEILWQMAIGAFMNVIFLLIILFIFAAFAFLLIVRLLMLQFLLILCPIVWLFWILPKTSNLWDQWWKTFLKWCFFAPASAFFIFLAIYSYKTLVSKSLADALRANDYRVFYSSFTDPAFLLQFLLVVGILFGGLIAAQKIGIYGAAGAIGLAKGTGKKISGVAATQRWWKARKTAREEEAKERVKRKAQLRRVGGVEQWRRETLRPTAKGRAEARAKKNEVIIKEAQKMGATMDLQNTMKIAGKRMPLTKSGRMQKLAAQALLTNPKSKQYQQMINRSKMPKPGTRKYEKIRKLATKTYQNISKKTIKDKLKRYQWKGKEVEEAVGGVKGVGKQQQGGGPTGSGPVPKQQQQGGGQQQTGRKAAARNRRVARTPRQQQQQQGAGPAPGPIGPGPVPKQQQPQPQP